MLSIFFSESVLAGASETVLMTAIVLASPYAEFETMPASLVYNIPCDILVPGIFGKPMSDPLETHRIHIGDPREIHK